AFIVKALPAPVAGLSSLGVPIGAVLMAWLILGERPGMIEVVGMVLICVGLLVISGFRIGARRAPTPTRNTTR
ncbi:MAG TPA: EamA family transporter, partial [Nevskiaceae bacterium]|nr:EamA family transporter [Nevskiaceae bacterium]